ncbi:MAG: molecular chaperone [Candidatus Brennerbacteria bacterium CG11_big_fil_rev_8_21_14_0_20_43_10]|uniref:Molecular chaperone n=3 Tax=Candidatus Brenneribacteriota TaxID=1817902 RepID=A0A2M8C3K4_9BACT|nr:MAG: hypothetical protein AUJ43_01875 [Parcubacteria group bacterium CG1_02_44_31]PIP50211.1 MAG: molecular chaperone [Candidatus Brennerbacteria bacterium CG23_combo_of_CG06-09_8_20_14_all_44_41]PIR26258.1 MAG: molecular chaperone [Candidatus Brennerbacteria bacterium CG11_big_fil_rev_8_21_14_0_20_43_10]PIX29024.1 MAG: molecular chaperone [Candidatus Brennerbacteria bacterium CG_4_8_14_3_um_filter_43_14]PJA19374.1 MAG: molecular chaperone [Candidatus Brennerbacteria bacterium CG_4_10_14_0_2
MAKTPKTNNELKQEDQQDKEQDKEQRDVFLPAAELEGELAVDVYQTPTEIVIQSPIAGVDENDIDISLEGDMITIRGKRAQEQTVDEKDFFYQECYWGSFSRTVSLPTSEVDIDKAQAVMKNSILTIRIPKIDKKRSKKLKIQSAP